MYLMRRVVETGYSLSKPLLFRLTQEDPEVAHEAFIRFSEFANRQGLDRILFDNPANRTSSGLEISPAAGFNKNGDIPPNFLRYLGFERNVIGTVTADSYLGNERPRIMRFPGTESIVNWMGLPGAGVKQVRENLKNYVGQNMPLTISVMSTPRKTGLEALKDIETTVKELRGFPFVDRFEPNLACPNTPSTTGNLDARKENQKHLGEIIQVVKDNICPNTQQIYVKISPDLRDDDIKYTFDVLMDKGVAGIVATNTTRNHDPQYITRELSQGGASGLAVVQKAFDVQRKFYQLIKEANSDMRIIACGGIDNISRINQRLKHGASEIQVYTGFIFKGPRFIREVREAF